MSHNSNSEGYQQVTAKSELISQSAVCRGVGIDILVIFVC